MDQANQPAHQIQVKVPEQTMPGVYANTMGVAHTKEEFVMDFMNLIPHQGAGLVVSRVITSPAHFKRIIAALSENLAKYEKQFGKIEASKGPEQIGFRTA